MNTYINCRPNRRITKLRRILRGWTIPQWADAALDAILGYIAMAIMILFAIGLMAQGR